MNQISSNKRIAKNTILLYLRTLVIWAVSLYTSRLLLQALGKTDFGIYNVVGGIMMFMLLLQMQPGDVPVTFDDTLALERDFGIKSHTPLRGGLRKFVEWNKEFYG